VKHPKASKRSSEEETNPALALMPELLLIRSILIEDQPHPTDEQAALADTITRQANLITKKLTQTDPPNGAPTRGEIKGGYLPNREKP
jgi:hypothetical protein